ncbi:hypothetical protein ACFLWC_04870 [Chloroflexota bacterium]
MKEYKLILAKDGKYKTGFPTEFNEIKTIIDQYQDEGWNLYKCDVLYINAAGSIGPIGSSGFYHHLIFEKEKVS